MKRKLLLFRYSLYFLFSFVFFYGCTKIDTTTVGGSVLPAVDNINTFEESFDVVTKNYTDLSSDTVEIFGTDAHVLGHTDDPIFGKTEASIFLQTGLPSFPFNYSVKKDSLFLDSAVLVVGFSGVYGDSLAKQKINAFEITDPSFRAFTDNKYTVQKFSKINQQYIYNNVQLLGSAFVSPVDIRAKRILDYKKDSVAINQLRIRVSDALGRSFLDQDSAGSFKNDSTFRSFFKGFALVPEASAGGNALMYFQPSNSRLLIYHRVQKRDGKIDTTLQSFGFTVFSANGNYIKRDRSVGEIAAHLDNNNGDDVMYLQGTPGTYARVVIPGLENLSNRIVHRAELVMKQIWNGPQKLEDDLYAAGIVYPEVYNTDSAKVNTVDSLIFNPSLPSIYAGDFFTYVGGIKEDTLDASSKLVGKYNINLTRYIQGVITRRFKNYPLHLTIPYRPERFKFLTQSISFAPLTPLASGRLKAGGGSHAQYKMYLRIIYSKIQ